MLKILKESNNESAQILSQAITSGKLKDDARNTVIRANDLFNALSENGNNVLVQIKNDGTTILRSLLNDGYVQVTVTGPTGELKLYSGGQFELNKENLDKINNILDIIKGY